MAGRHWERNRSIISRPNSLRIARGHSGTIVVRLWARTPQWALAIPVGTALQSNDLILAQKGFPDKNRALPTRADRFGGGVIGRIRLSSGLSRFLWFLLCHGRACRSRFSKQLIVGLEQFWVGGTAAGGTAVLRGANFNS
jgi:hypothetical protein